MRDDVCRRKPEQVHFTRLPSRLVGNPATQLAHEGAAAASIVNQNSTSSKVRCLKKLVVFDLDGTLAESKSPLDPEMSKLLHGLLGILKVAVISGGDWPQFEAPLLSHLPQDDRLLNLSLLPTCGTKFYQYSGEWKKLYEEDFSAQEREKIFTSFEKALAISGLKAEKTWGPSIEDRGSQITFSALGQQAPLEEKNRWDPDYVKRKNIKDVLDTFIPEFLFGWEERHPLISQSQALIRPMASESFATFSVFQRKR